MARRGVIARGGELQCRIAAQRQQRLDAALAEAAVAHDHRAAMILQRAGDDLGGRGGTGIDQHDDRHALGDIATEHGFGLVDHALAARAAALRYDSALVEEQVR